MITTDHTKRHLTLISVHDNGGLTYPSDDVVSIIKVCDKYFKMYVRGNGESINASRNLQRALNNAIISELSITCPSQVLFSSLLQHDIDTHFVDEDLHSTQIMKAIVSKFMTMRLLRYAQEYSNEVVKKDVHGKRQQMNKLVLFSGL